MNQRVLQRLKDEDLLTDAEASQVEAYYQDKPVSVHWDLRTVLYFGILSLASGLGVFVYKNIDSIGHVALLALTAAACASCFAYCVRLKPPYSHGRVVSPNTWYDYVLLLGCLLMVTFMGYLQFQYHVFGDRWGMASFVPMVLLFVCAYAFDHIGVLCMAIANLGLWLGVAVDPLKLMAAEWHNQGMIWDGITFGILMQVSSIVSITRQVKPHFAPSYKNFGLHILFVSLLAGMIINFEHCTLWFLGLLAAGVYHGFAAFGQRSFYFFVMTFLYAYFGLSIFVLSAMVNLHDGVIGGAFIYFSFSCGGAILFLRHFYQIMKRDDSVQ